MNNAKKIADKRNFSVKDMMIVKFERNKKKIRELQAENEQIKEQWKHSGSFSTRNYEVTVTKSRVMKVISMKKGLELYGSRFEKYLETMTRHDFKVTKKGA